MEQAPGQAPQEADGERRTLNDAQRSLGAGLATGAARGPATSAKLIPGRFDRRFAGGFDWYVSRLFRKRFHAVRLLREDRPAFAELDSAASPAIVAINHPGWWDPLVAFFLARRLLPSRTTSAPMDAEQLLRFGFFKRIGVFGIDPDHPGSAAAMSSYVGELFGREPRTTLWITPQGRFTDVREPLRLRPGAAMVAARAAGAARGVRVLVAAIEYGFWQDQTPEVFVAAQRVEPPGGPAPGAGRGTAVSTTAWHRTIESAMVEASTRLAAAVIARDPAPFEALSGGERARINPLYDLWLRARGRDGEIPARRGDES